MTTTEVLGSANELLASHSVLILNVRLSQQKNRRQLNLLHSPPQELLRLPLIPTPPPSPPPDDSPASSPVLRSSQLTRTDLTPAKRARVARYTNYVPEEETIRNDYSQRYVDAGEWPQNWVLGAEPEHRFEEYPKQQRLLNLKKASVNTHCLPPSYLSLADMSTLQPSKFDVILLDPPFSSSFTWDHLQELPIPTLAGDPSFVFLWVGSGAGEGLERGREVLAKWGYRRCEDVVWVKTNKTSNKGPGTDPPTTSLLTRTKQHCLIGIRGTVRRSTDSWFVHCNVDTDVIFWEGDATDPTRKPPEMYTLIENFCLGLRRLEIFGRPSSLRRGWVTMLGQGQEDRLPPVADALGTIHVEGEQGGRATRWERETWEDGIKELSNGGKPVVPMTPEIDALRPKSPFRPNQTNASGNMAPPVGNNRFGNRPGFGGVSQGVQGPMHPPNQMMVQPMLGMGMNTLGLGMGGVGVDEMMGQWNPMMGMGAMNMGGMGGMNVGGLGAINATGMANVGRLGMPMMGPMMGNAGFGAGGGVFNPAMGGGGMGWTDQGQFGLEGGWDGDGMMGSGVNGMGGGMNMNMNMGGGMGMGPWPGQGTFEGFH
ncbi:MT-A70-domain-containing protein [Collybia nuda]|uniref:MT-A70-domain-containing protein n=1 Tax=Collybia nuda TaxID=64659 RepID=A0A9P5Y7S5_9AGAR|nr:MT-A70-domain-containing protein [Collybia nuda]